MPPGASSGRGGSTQIVPPTGRCGLAKRAADRDHQGQAYARGESVEHGRRDGHRVGRRQRAGVARTAPGQAVRVAGLVLDRLGVEEPEPLGVATTPTPSLSFCAAVISLLALLAMTADDDVQEALPRLGWPRRRLPTAVSNLSLLRQSQTHALRSSAQRQASALPSQTVAQRALGSASGGMTSRATRPAATALPGENLGSIDGPGERVGRIDRVTQHDPERR